MAASALNILKEAARQELSGDTSFYKKLPYFFELRVPAEVGGAFGNSYLLPLPLNPSEVEISEPFAVEETPTLEGGLYVEESGIIRRTIRIRGNTGFKPRQLGATVGIGLLAKPDKKSYTRELPTIATTNLSGQRLFQWMQDRLFRTYADLKRDPTTAKDTILIWHNQKDDEHWVVVPRTFGSSRSAQSPVTYPYDIELLVVDRADAAEFSFSEDQSILATIRDAIRTVKSYVDLVSGAIKDLTAIVNEIRQLVATIGTLIDAVGNIVKAATDFVNGVTDLIETPLAIVHSAIELCEDVTTFIDESRELGGVVADFPENLTNSFRQLQDALEGIASKPEAFVTPANASMSAIASASQLSTSTSAATRDAAAANSPGTLNAFGRMGTGLMPGDALRALAEDPSGGGPQYQSVRSYTIGQGDTLQGLASRFLGDARLWRHIAVINGLRPPFITDIEMRDLGSGTAIPGTLGRGQSILIPSFAKPPLAQPSPATLGVKPTESNEIHLLGRDIKLSPRPGPAGFYIIEVDREAGATDVRKVSGIANLKQALQTRVETEQGSCMLYRRLGMRRVVGLGNRFSDQEVAKFRVVEALTSDPRIAAMRSIRFGGDLDVLEIDTELEVRGFSQPAQILMGVR